MQDFLYHNLFLEAPFFLYLFAITASCVISLYAVRKIIFITKYRKIYDIPDDVRKFHGVKIPILGGVGIFIGYIVIGSFFMIYVPKNWNYVVASSIILFFVGIYDDLMNMKPTKKLIAQLLASFLSIYFANIRLTSLEGIFGIGEIPFWLSIIFTTTLCTFFINVFNFIDGIDGLACVTAIFYTLVIGGLFAGMSNNGMACLSFCLAGSTLGLLYYNKAPAKIYMGDTGSMLLGFSIFIFIMQLINCYKETDILQKANILTTFLPNIQCFLIFIFSVIFLPIYDAFRVFIIRASKGISPLKADRTHLHYYLLDAGYTHTKSVVILLSFNVAIIMLGYLLKGINPVINLLCILMFSTIIVAFIYSLRKRYLEVQKCQKSFN